MATSHMYNYQHVDMYAYPSAASHHFRASASVRGGSKYLQCDRNAKDNKSEC